MLRLLTGIAAAAIAYGAPSDAGLVGAWKGDSSCAVKESACRDETVVYRLAKIPEKPGAFSVSADKMVEGKPINMGTLEFRYDEGEHVLTCQYSQGVWRLKVAGDTIEGTLTRSDNTVFRRLTLHKTP